MRHYFSRISIAIVLGFFIVGVFQLLLVEGATLEKPLIIVTGQQKIADNTGGMGPLSARGNFGAGVKGLGDMNNDGIPDLAVGSAYAGVFNLLFLKADGTVSSTTFLANTSRSSEQKLSITKVGDLNSDGTPDLAIGDPNYFAPSWGAVQILFMKDNSVISATMITNTPSSLFGPWSSKGYLGSDIAAIGDLNQDGVPDLAVGAPGVNNQGIVYILFMKADGTVSNTVSITPFIGYHYGKSVAAIGDLNQDGIIDLAVGDQQGGFPPAPGVIYIHLMKADGTVSSTKNISLGLSGNAFGWSVAGVGDLNHDNIPDITAGDYLDDTDEQDNGAVYIFLMKADGTVSRTIKLAENTNGLGDLSRLGNFGSDVSLLGDVNGDGNSDLAVGAFFDDTGGTYGTGAVYILFLSDILDKEICFPIILKQ